MIGPWGQKLVFHGAPSSVWLVKAWWKCITSKTGSSSLPDSEMRLGLPTSRTSKFLLIANYKCTRRGLWNSNAMGQDKESPLLSSQWKDWLFELQQKTWVSWPEKSSHKMNYSGTEKMSHVSRPRPCVFSVAGTLWCSQHILHTVWKLCTGNDTPGWGSIHIATIGIPFSHSQSTGCPTPVASRYTTLIFSVPLRTNLSLRQTYRLRKCHKHFHISYK